ncbi:MAG: transglutaminase domain-containing protein [Lachnospiraceae bacterium]|nr:transglutaminase domain-containing protein [Lachnospiraceae bacterium]
MKISDLFRKKTARKNILPALPIFDAASELRTEGAMKLSGKRAILVDVLLELLISVLSGYSFVYVFTSAFGLQVRAYLFFPALILLSFIVLLIARDKKIGVFLFLAAIGGAVVFSILKLQLLVGECTGIYDRLVSAFDEAYKTETSIHYTVMPDTDVTFIMIVFSVLPVWQTGYSYGRNIPPFIATAFMLIPPVLAAVCLKPPGLLPIAVLVLCILMQVILCRSECLSEDHEMSRSTQLRIRFFLSASAAVLLLVLTLFSAFLVFPALKKPFAKASDVYSRSSITDLLAKIKGNPFDISKPGMSGGDFSNVGSVVRNEKTIMTVQFQQNRTDSTYLRGFTGSRYTGDAWEIDGAQIDETMMPQEIGFSDIYTGRVDPKDANFRNPFLYVNALYSGTYRHSTNAHNLISITENDDRDDYVYLPYFVNGGESAGISSAVFVSDLYMTEPGKEKAVFQTVFVDSLHEAIEMASAKQYLQGLTQPSGDPLAGYEELQSMITLLHDRWNINVTQDEILQSPYTEYVVNDSSGAEIHMRLLEDCVIAYENHAISSNLASGASARVRDLAKEIAAEFQISPDAMEYEKAVEAVRKYLFRHKQYSLNPGGTASDADFVEDFLFNKDSGYCVHFASAATVLLRELGIPCRYVEGYLVQPAMSGEKVEISDRDAHAWTEVYIRGFGWYPVEMTLSREDEQDAAESSFTLSSSEEPETTTETLPSVSEDPSASTDAAVTESGEGNTPETSESPYPGADPSDGGGENQGGSGKEPFRLPDWFLPVLLSVLLAAALIAAVLYLRYHITPLEKMRLSSNKKTCRRIYDRIRRQAGRTGLRFCPDSSAAQVAKLYPEIDPKRLSEMQRIIKEVCYKKEEASEEDISFLYGIYEERLLMNDPFLRKP